MLNQETELRIRLYPDLPVLRSGPLDLYDNQYIQDPTCSLSETVIVSVHLAPVPLPSLQRHAILFRYPVAPATSCGSGKLAPLTLLTVHMQSHTPCQ